MRVKSRAFWAVLVLLASGGGYVTWAAIRAHSNLVTLNVRDMEVRKVLGKIGEKGLIQAKGCFITNTACQTCFCLSLLWIASHNN